MLIRRTKRKNTLERLKEEMGRELTLSFGKKGIQISGVQIDMDPDKINVSIYIDNPDVLNRA